MFSRKSKSIIERCESDTNTRLRLKYAPYYRVIDSADGVNIMVEGRPMVMMSTNEYLGLIRHPKVVAAAKKALDVWGASSCGSRLANGSRAYHIELEEALAAFLGKEVCHVTSAGYLACICSLSSLVQRDDVLLHFVAYLYSKEGRVVDYSFSYFLPGYFRFHVVRKVG